MTDNALVPIEIYEVRPGDQVVVSGHRAPRRGGGVFWYSGIADDVAPKLNILWIRDSELGERRMIDTFEHRLFRPAPPTRITGGSDGDVGAASPGRPVASNQDS